MYRRDRAIDKKGKRFYHPIEQSSQKTINEHHSS